MAIDIKLCILYTGSGIFLALSLKTLLRSLQLSKKLDHLSKKKTISPSQLEELFEKQGENADIIIKNETEKLLKNAFVFGRAFSFTKSDQNSDFFYHEKRKIYRLSSYEKMKDFKITTLPFKLVDGNNSRKKRENIFVSVHQNNRVDCLFPLQKIKTSFSPNTLTFFETIGTFPSQIVLFVLRILKFPQLKNVFLGVDDEELGIRFGTEMVVYGDVIYNLKDKTMRIEHPLNFLSSTGDLVSRLRSKIWRNGLVLAFSMTLFVGCLYFAIRANKYANRNQKKNINRLKLKIGNNEKHITTQGKDFRCMLCRTKQKNIILHPCSHLVMCKDCLEKNNQKAKSCPLCKENYTATIEILIP